MTWTVARTFQHSIEPTRRRLLQGTALAVFAGSGLMPVSTLAQGVRTFVFANPSEYDTLDPHTVFDNSRVATRLNFYDGLYRWLDNPPKAFALVGRKPHGLGRRARLPLQA